VRLIEFLLISFPLLVNRISIKRAERRGVCEADKSWASTFGLVSVGPRDGVRGFRTYDCSTGISGRPARRTRGDSKKDTNRPGERRYPIHRRKRRWTRRSTSKAAKAEAMRASGDFLRNEPNRLCRSEAVLKATVRLARNAKIAGIRRLRTQTT